MDRAPRIVGLLGEIAGREAQFSAITPLLKWRGRYCYPVDFNWTEADLFCWTRSPAILTCPARANS